MNSNWEPNVDRILDQIESSRTRRIEGVAKYRGKGFDEDIPESQDALPSSWFRWQNGDYLFP